MLGASDGADGAQARFLEELMMTGTEKKQSGTEPDAADIVWEALSGRAVAGTASHCAFNARDQDAVAFTLFTC